MATENLQPAMDPLQEVMVEPVMETLKEVVVEAINATAANATAPTKTPSTPEGVAIAYGSLVLMALLPIFLGSFRWADVLVVSPFHCGLEQTRIET